MKCKTPQLCTTSETSVSLCRLFLGVPVGHNIPAVSSPPCSWSETRLAFREADGVAPGQQQARPRPGPTRAHRNGAARKGRSRHPVPVRFRRSACRGWPGRVGGGSTGGVGGGWRCGSSKLLVPRGGGAGGRGRARVPAGGRLLGRSSPSSPRSLWARPPAVWAHALHVGEEASRQIPAALLRTFFRVRVVAAPLRSIKPVWRHCCAAPPGG